MASRFRSRLWLIPLILALWAVFSLGTYYAWIHGADHRDFYPWWAASRLHLFNGRDLYDPATTHEMQLMLYGHTLPANRDQQAFHYPAQLVVLFMPFWFINNVEIAASIWSGLSLLLILAAMIILARLSNLRRAIGLPLLLLLWPFPMLVIFQAQSTSLPLFGLAAAFWCFQKKRDVLAGIVMSLALVKPELAFIPWLIMLWIAFNQRRWKMIFSFLCAQAILLLLSFAVAGWWIPGWLGAIQRYSGYAQSTWAPTTAWQVNPILALGLLAWFIFVLIKTHWTDANLFAASILIGLLALPQTLIWNLTMLLIPLTLAWRSSTFWLVGLIWLIGWIVIPFPGTWQLQYLFLPLLTLTATFLASRSQINASSTMLLKKSGINV